MSAAVNCTTLNCMQYAQFLKGLVSCLKFHTPQVVEVVVVVVLVVVVVVVVVVVAKCKVAKKEGFCFYRIGERIPWYLEVS
jgi:hypothetical protein